MQWTFQRCSERVVEQMGEFSDTEACEIPKEPRSVSVRDFSGQIQSASERMLEQMGEVSDIGACEIPQELRSVSVRDFSG